MTKLIEGSPNQELTNSEKTRGKLGKKSVTISGVLLALAGSGCDIPDPVPPITEGVVYNKEYIEKRIENDVLMAGDFMITNSRTIPEKFKVQIAQCPQGKIPEEKDKIGKECETNSIYVAGDIYNSLQIGQYADLKQYKSSY